MQLHYTYDSRTYFLDFLAIYPLKILNILKPTKPISIFYSSPLIHLYIFH